MENMMKEKLAATFANEAIAAKLKEAADIEQMRKVLAENGVEFTDEELAQFISQAAKSADNGELDETQMEEVSGGIVRTALKALNYTWKYACYVYGGPREAAHGIYDYWSGVFR